MARTASDPHYRHAFAGRLRQALEGQPAGLGVIAAALGYSDDTTLRAAMAARSQLDLDRLARLAAWTQEAGEPIDLHWLLTGVIAKKPTEDAIEAGWLTSERIRALRVLAESVPSLPGLDGQTRATTSHRARQGKGTVG